MRSPVPVRAGLLAALAFAVIAFVAPPSHAAVSACATDAGYTIVKLQNVSYNPAAAAVPKAGQYVCFEQDDPDPNWHTVTFDPPARGDLDSNPSCDPATGTNCFRQGDPPYIVQMTTDGVYHYHCKVHSSMKGVVTVGNGVAPTTATTAPKSTPTTTAGGRTATTVGSISTETTTAPAATTTSSEAASTTVPLTTQTTRSALSKSSSNKDEPSAVLKAIGIVLLAAVVAALIPSWRRLT